MKTFLPLLAVVAASLAARAADPLEGRWQFGGDGAVVEFVADQASQARMNIVLRRSPDLSVEPGSVVGYAVPSPADGVYDCRMAIDPAPGKTGGKTANFALTLADDAQSFTVKPYRRNRRISLWRWIPYLFRITVVTGDNRPDGLDGARRVSPPGRPAFLVL